MKKTSMLLLVIMALSIGTVAAANFSGELSANVGETKTYTVSFEADDVVVSDWTTGIFEQRWCAIGAFKDGVLVAETGFVPCSNGDSVSLDVPFGEAGAYIIGGWMLESQQEYVDGVWVTNYEHSPVDNAAELVMAYDLPFEPSGLLPPGTLAGFVQQ